MELIIAEKPSAAAKIAAALALGKPPEKKSKGKTHWFELERNGKSIVVAPAVGHLFGLAPRSSGNDYPVLDGEWKPTFEISSENAFARDYYENIKALAKHADEFVSACDYDVEGEVIAANILEFLCGTREARRMKFSTLTSEELEYAYENAAPKISEGMRDAGRARHYLDFAWGLSISRALMAAVRRAGAFRVLSIGRVQGPALALLAEREKKIAAFVPKPYWQLVALYDGTEFLHVKQKFESEREADAALARCNKDGFVSAVEKKKLKLRALPPFDLTTLQTEAYRCFGITPARTMQAAQALYEAALISYPRSASQKLPPQLNLKKIISQLATNPSFEKHARELIEKNRVKPVEGDKTDPAHPAVHPTGLKPSALRGEAAKIYDLIARRFLACFAEDGEAERVSAELTLGRERFFAQGDRITKKGWIDFYAPYAKIEEKQMPDLRLHQKLSVDKIEKRRKMTQPPKRFTPASIVAELEEKELGTKATRAEIIETLYRRGYIEGKSIHVTPLGLAVADSLCKHVPEIMSEELTRHFEREMEAIQEGKTSESKVVEEGKREIARICAEFRLQEEAIGRELIGAVNEMQRKASVLGKCGKCEKGEIVVRRGKYGLFAACNAYPKCDNTFPLPRDAAVVATGKTCAHCRTPVVKVIRKGKRPFEMCLTPNCESKAEWSNKDQTLREKTKTEEAATETPKKKSDKK
ncbi:MAG: DNA topoisomerase I [Candidatus Norongarragalinales archaeon]